MTAAEQLPRVAQMTFSKDEWDALFALAAAGMAASVPESAAAHARAQISELARTSLTRLGRDRWNMLQLRAAAIGAKAWPETVHAMWTKPEGDAP